MDLAADDKLSLAVTTTEHGQTPIYNTVGQAIVDACVRAGKEGRKFRVIIVIPAIPGFPGDLRRSGATGTRAIMDYQFKSINRGEHSVMGRIASQGVDPNRKPCPSPPPPCLSSNLPKGNKIGRRQSIFLYSTCVHMTV